MKRKAFRSGFKKEHKGGAFLGLTGRYVASWRSDRSDRSLRSEWKQAKKSPTCFRRKISTETLIETKRKALRRGFKRERKGGPFLGLTGHYIASGSKPRRVLLVFVVKSQRKLRLRRNERRYNEDSKENAKEDPF
ncbi:hypothetical protein DY000_02030092 [Brassica cretica]|uniref:Uncharacterized protein n=1 Tax=Brassica cretica TaxID=69181 RepID=A0ABQ7DQP2_BRACR|nr:hypothetical protein DY000_02030092 [Brassica cretica]